MSAQDVRSRMLGVLALALMMAGLPQVSVAAPARAAAHPVADRGSGSVHTPVSTREASAEASYGLPDFADLVARVGPAVVNVEVVERARTRGNASQDPFGDFFHRFGIPRPIPPPRSAPVRGIGSGFIISSDGYILTNAHVVNNASKITVTLTDRRAFPARVIGKDERTDVAVIKIDAHGNLPVVRIGDSSKLRPGQWVLAIGSPFGFDNSVTAGVVSATERSDIGDDGNGYVPFIQTDVVVNPGNSGGPLFNLQGQVVGINSQIYSRSGGFEGISFAIPIDVAENVAQQLIRTGHVRRGRIGVTIQQVSYATAENLGLDRPRGAVVASVEPGGPAEQAGIEPLDVILSVNGTPIQSSDQLPSIIAQVTPGAVVHLQIWRNRRLRNVNVKVEQLKEEDPLARNGARGSGAASSSAGPVSDAGLSVRLLTPQEKSQLKTQGDIVVTGSTGPAADAGLRPGDVIVSVNRNRPHSVEEFHQDIKRAGHAATLLVQHDGEQLVVTVQY